MANTTWNPADKSSVVALSGGNLTATTTTTGTGGGVRSLISQSSGKYYYEIQMTVWVSSSSGPGAANASATLTSMGNVPTNAALVYPSGAIWVNNANSGSSLGARAAGNIIGIALDLNNKQIWFRVAPAGNWNGSGTANPATNTGGISVSSIAAGSVFAAAAPWNVNEACVANFGDSAFSGAVPSGFTAGFPAAPNYVDLAGNLGGVSSYGKLSYGLKKYSRVAAFAPIFAADFLVSAGVVFSGDFAPTVSFSADLGVVFGVSADLAPVISFGADALDIVGFIDFGGDLALQIDLGGSLSLDLSLTVLEGGLAPDVALAASSFISGPLWAASEPCPNPPWTPAEPCPPSLWTPTEPCDPVEWEKSELCNG